MKKYDHQLHPTTFQEAKGHGLKAWNQKKFPGGDSVIYYPDRQTSQVPKHGNDRHVKYTLVNIFEKMGFGIIALIKKPSSNGAHSVVTMAKIMQLMPPGYGMTKMMDRKKEPWPLTQLT